MKIVVLILLGLALIGCEDDPPSPEIEVYSGELAIIKIKESPPWTYPYTDTVTLTIEGGTYRLLHIRNASGLCNSEGKAIGFGTNRLRLTPTSVDYNNCDSLKVPQGEFKSIFEGDSLYLGPDTQVFSGQFTDTMIYHFRLTR